MYDIGRLGGGAAGRWGEGQGDGWRLQGMQGTGPGGRPRRRPRPMQGLKRADPGCTRTAPRSAHRPTPLGTAAARQRPRCRQRNKKARRVPPRTVESSARQLRAAAPPWQHHPCAAPEQQVDAEHNQKVHAYFPKIAVGQRTNAARLERKSKVLQAKHSVSYSDAVFGFARGQRRRVEGCEGAAQGWAGRVCGRSGGHASGTGTKPATATSGSCCRGAAHTGGHGAHHRRLHPPSTPCSCSPLA